MPGSRVTFAVAVSMSGGVDVAAETLGMSAVEAASG